MSFLFLNDLELDGTHLIMIFIGSAIILITLAKRINEKFDQCRKLREDNLEERQVGQLCDLIMRQNTDSLVTASRNSGETERCKDANSRNARQFVELELFFPLPILPEISPQLLLRAAA